MLWVDRLLTGAGLLSDLSWGFACPFHCGASGIPLLVCGLCIGLVGGFGLSLWVLFDFFSRPVQPVPSSFAPASSVASQVFPASRVRNRLRGYLDFDE